MKALVALVLTSAWLAAPAIANDSVAEVGTGGLLLGRTDAIEMTSEDLFLSMDRVTVDYVFTNKTDAAVRTVVAFPMPDIDTRPQTMVSLPGEGDDFLGFTVEVDGKAVNPTLQQHAYANGVDVTGQIVAAGLPLAPFSQEAYQRVQSLRGETLIALAALGAVSGEIGDGQVGPDTYIEPAWVLKSAYWWEMTFPPNQAIRVRHQYRPSVGGSAGLFFLMAGEDGTKADPAMVEKYCMDDVFLRAARKRQEAMSSGGPGYYESRISYVLTTGANWAGPIRSFRLTIDKGRPDNLVSFCGENVRRTGPTTFVMEQTDFWPSRDLDILFAVKADQ